MVASFQATNDHTCMGHFKIIAIDVIEMKIQCGSPTGCLLWLVFEGRTPRKTLQRKVITNLLWFALALKASCWVHPSLAVIWQHFTERGREREGLWWYKQYRQSKLHIEFHWDVLAPTKLYNQCNSNSNTMRGKAKNSKRWIHNRFQGKRPQFREYREIMNPTLKIVRDIACNIFCSVVLMQSFCSWYRGMKSNL